MVSGSEAGIFVFLRVLRGFPIPEPSTYAAIMGLLTLGVVLYRRRKKA